MEPELVAIAKIVRTRGLRGQVVAEVLTDFPERFEGLREVTALLRQVERRRLKIEDFWFQKNRIVLKFEGVDSIEAAEDLRGAEVCVDEEAAVELGENEFFDWELIGCSVETVAGEGLGTVREVMRTGGTEVLLVDGAEGEFMIPFAEAICVEVDVEAKRIVADPPEGLLEF
ncbi:MAG TPA: ribosome maturation factor RimM [Pyrinomonadaceae bacterium]|nr:ribosome maturation factor RimM [Pyrinomonadaceae bacterium]